MTDTGATCVVRGCASRVHGRGLCRVHFDQHRYLESTGQTPELLEEQGREWAIRDELRFGCVPEFRSPHSTHSMFADDDEHREAWEERREELLAEYRDGRSPGSRPWAWWRFEAGRPPHLTPLDVAMKEWHGPGPIEKRAALYDEWEMEPTIYLASIGDLSADELATIERQAEEAQERIDTGDERYGSGGIDMADRRRVKLWQAVSEA